MQPTPKHRPDGWTLENARLLFSSRVHPLPSGCYEIDPETWQSIGGDEVFQSIDRSCCFAGSQELYRSLRCPSLAQDNIEAAEACISLLKAQPSTKERLELRLATLDHDSAWHTYELLVKDPAPLPLARWQLGGLALLSPISLTLALVFSSWFWGLALLCFAVNTFLHFRVSMAASTRMDALFSLRRVVRACAKIATDKHLTPLLSSFDLRANLTLTRKFAKGGFLVDLSDPTGFLDYLKICILYDARFYASRFHMLQENLEAFRQLLFVTGFLDRCIGVLRLREELKGRVSCPQRSNKDALELQDCMHPLLDPDLAISNSICVQSPGAILTGLNMGGKSTFLKSVAVNALLSQSINTVFCSSYTAPFFRIYAVTSNSDNLSEGKSHYMQELVSIHTLVKACTNPHACLFVVDEMFRGTNSDERIAACAAVLDELGKTKIVLAATHDLEVLSLTSPAFEHFNFSGLIEDQSGLHFDYQLRRGRCKQRNALRLMQQLGYPSDLVTHAQEICDSAATPSGHHKLNI